MRNCDTCRYGGHGEKGCMVSATGTPRYLPADGCPMYAMSARAFMDRVTNAQRRIVSMEERAARYRDMAMRATGSMQAVRTGGTPARSKVEDGMCAFLDICKDIEEEALKLREVIRETSEVIGRLTDAMEREVLELRYLSGCKWEDVARRMMYDERQVRRIHVRALEHVQREMDLMELSAYRLPPGGSAAGSTAGCARTPFRPS